METKNIIMLVSKVIRPLLSVPMLYSPYLAGVYSPLFSSAVAVTFQQQMSAYKVLIWITKIFFTYCRDNQ